LRSNFTHWPDRKVCIRFTKWRMVGFDDWQAVEKVFWINFKAESWFSERIILNILDFPPDSRHSMLNAPKTEGMIS
jgi:hypothetical protein